MNVHEHIMNIYPNILRMLEARGYTYASLPDITNTDHLLYKINLFVETDNLEKASAYLDLYIHNIDLPQSDFVCYIKPSESTNLKMFLKKITAEAYPLNLTRIVNEYGLDVSRDNITFILLNKICTDEEYELIQLYETNYPHVRLFESRQFISDVTSNILVPTHEKFPEDQNEALKKSLMLTSFKQLPTILHSDKMSRIHNFRNGDIVKITRRTHCKDSEYYRLCV